MQSLPYDVVIDPRGVWYGPAGTEPYSRDWLCFDDVGAFFSIVSRQDFHLNVVAWRVHVGAYDVTLADVGVARNEAAYYGNLARVAIRFAVSNDSDVEQHAAYCYARSAWHAARQV